MTAKLKLPFTPMPTPQQSPAASVERRGSPPDEPESAALKKLVRRMSGGVGYQPAPPLLRESARGLAVSPRIQESLHQKKVGLGFDRCQAIGQAVIWRRCWRMSGKPIGFRSKPKSRL
jgi:hypothetical protein